MESKMLMSDDEEYEMFFSKQYKSKKNGALQHTTP